MHSGRLIFSQLMDYLPHRAFDHCVNKYSGFFGYTINAVKPQIWIAVGLHSGRNYPKEA